MKAMTLIFKLKDISSKYLEPIWPNSIEIYLYPLSLLIH